MNHQIIIGTDLIFIIGLTLKLPQVTKTEFPPTISVQPEQTSDEN